MMKTYRGYIMPSGNRFFSSISFKPIQHLFHAITELSTTEQKALAIEIYPLFKKKTLISIQKKLQAATKYQTMTPPKFTASIEALAQASRLADSLLDIQEPTSLSHTDKSALADAHAQYASALYKFRPSETELSETVLSKDYQLDPDNITTQRLIIDMNHVVSVNTKV